MKYLYFAIIFISNFLANATAKAQYANLFDFNNVSNGSGPIGTLRLSQNKLFGMTKFGGANGLGIVYSLNTNGSGYKNLFDFVGLNGANPSGSLTLSVTGDTLFGTTESGGPNFNPSLHTYGHGCIFSIKTDGSGYKKIFDFDGITTGGGPRGTLVLYQNKLYGMTGGGGANDLGSVFSINTDGTGFKTLLDFDGTNGGIPNGTLIRLGNILYGMTLKGVSNYGNIFLINTDGTGYKNLFDFSLANSNGGGPFGDLTLSENTLYGMTYGNGGQAGCVFSIKTDGSGYKDLHDFSNNITDGGFPMGSLVRMDSLLYGITYSGGFYNNGIIFSIDTNGTEYKNIFDFNTPVTGGSSGTSLTFSITGDTLFGPATGGGPNGHGVIFSYYISPVGVNELGKLNNLEVSVFPNPASSYIQINVYAKKTAEVILNIYDIYGRLMLFEKKQLATGINIISKNIIDFTSGVYFLQLTDLSGLQQTQKQFIVK